MFWLLKRILCLVDQPRCPRALFPPLAQLFNALPELMTLLTCLPQTSKRRQRAKTINLWLSR